LQLGEYLDQFQEPVIVINGVGRVLAANQPMANLLGKSEREVAGLLGGEAMECVYARLPGGCGHTTHCKTCTIRNTVTTTRESSIPQSRVPAYLDQDDGRTRFVISSKKVRGTILVIIEEIEPPAVPRSIRSA
jgi:PAS domain-containing protein